MEGGRERDREEDEKVNEPLRMIGIQNENVNDVAV